MSYCNPFSVLPSHPLNSLLAELLKPLADGKVLVGTWHTALLPDLQAGCHGLWGPGQPVQHAQQAPWCYLRFCTSVLVSLFRGLSREKRREMKHPERNLFFYQNFHFKLQLLSFLMWKLMIREIQRNAAFFLSTLQFNPSSRKTAQSKLFFFLTTFFPMK